MRLFLSFILLLSVNFIDINAQNKQADSTRSKSSFFEDVDFGGGIQLSFGNGYTAIGVSPSAVYGFSDQWAAGVSVTYLYVNENLYNFDYNIYGASTLVLYNPIEELQLNTEFEMLNVHQKNGEQKNQYWVPAWYVGAGYAISKRGTIGLRYDILFDKDKSVYRDALTPYVKFYF
jgi:long-subunit fatty acid transport protein